MKKYKKIKFEAENKFAYDVSVCPKPSIEFIPDWYKKIHPYINKKNILVRNGTVNTTIKACTPFLEAMTAGYMLTLSHDIAVSFENGVQLINWKGNSTVVTDHSPEQFNGLQIPEGYTSHVFKWHNNFIINMPKGFSMFCTHPSNRFDLPFITMSGLVEMDRYNLSTQFPFFLKEKFEGVIEKGTPVAQLIPIKRENWISESKYLDREERDNRYEEFGKTLLRSYKKNFWVKKEYN